MNPGEIELIGEKATVTQWNPFVQWNVPCDTFDGNPFDIEADVAFTHAESKTSLTTPMFYTGDNAWAFRFTGTITGQWDFVSKSDIERLNGVAGQVVVENNPDASATGFITSNRNKWMWQATKKVFVPQLVMYRSPDEFHNNPDMIDRDIAELIDGHGFNGFHVPVYCRWFDIERTRHIQFDETDPNPDARTFEALELLITRANAAGCMVHLWMWGDNDANHRQTPMKDEWGGKNGRVDLRLQRYLAARLGPVPGWSMGYGYDLEHWVDEQDLHIWCKNLSRLCGWRHLFGGRAGGPKNHGALEQVYDGADYASYTHFRPTYDDYRTVLDIHPDKPVFSEDRFRIRNPSPYPHKDYSPEMIRKGMWHSTMAGGVANIWGGFETSGKAGGFSEPLSNKELLKTYRQFFANRFSAGMSAERTQDGLCLLKDETRNMLVAFKEEADSISIALDGLSGTLKAIAVDAKSRYCELPVEIGDHAVNWKAPHVSDWAIAVG